MVTSYTHNIKGVNLITTYDMPNIIPGLNRRAIKHVIEITKDHFPELDKNNIKRFMHRKLCMKQIPDCVWKLSVWCTRPGLQVDIFGISGHSFPWCIYYMSPKPVEYCHLYNFSFLLGQGRWKI